MCSIPRITDPQTSWLFLLTEFGFKNQPFILLNWSTANWTSRQKWVYKDGKPNYKYLQESFGDSTVPILINGNEYETTKLETYLENIEENGNPEAYLKDWHFQKQYGISMYNLHPFFTRDFINCERWTECTEINPFGDDYRFVYLGTAGSWTKFHSDVVSSHSWSANICGRKYWLMIPPGNEKFFHDDNISGFVDDIRKHEHLFEKARVISFVQEPGEIVFVPSNWYHQVHNMTDTISINHNWINSTNLSIVRDFLTSREIDVRNELRDCESLFSFEEFEEKVEMLDQAQLSEIYKCAINGTRLAPGIIKGHDVYEISQIGKIFKACNDQKSSQPIEIANNIDARTKSDMLEVLNKSRKEKSLPETQWDVNIVVGNSHVAKSLRPIVNIKMPTQNGEILEFDLDSFSQFRHQVAQSLLEIIPEK